MDPVLVDERELAVKVQKILVRGSASDNGEESAVRILLESDVSVGELRIINIPFGLESKETLDVVPEPDDYELFLGGKKIACSAGLELLGTGGVPDGIKPDNGVSPALIVLDELLDGLVLKVNEIGFRDELGYTFLSSVYSFELSNESPYTPAHFALLNAVKFTNSRYPYL